MEHTEPVARSGQDRRQSRSGQQDLGVAHACELDHAPLVFVIELRGEIVEAQDRPVATNLGMQARLGEHESEGAQLGLSAGQMLAAWRMLETEYIMSNNFAFGGINTSLIFKRIYD